MSKKLVAAAISGALTAPAAFAQSSVTISGFLKGGFEGLRYGNSAKANAGQTGVADDSSRLIFNVTEDLAGGLQAIGQLEFRASIDGGVGNNGTGAFGATGNNHVGLRSKQWGRIFFGRQDLHYHNRTGDLAVKAAQRADSLSILGFAGGGGQTIALVSRTPNVVHYTTPNWGGFQMIAAYSSNPAAALEADIGSGIRHGRAWNLNPSFEGADYQLGYSYWRSKNDAGGNTIATGDQRADRLYGIYRWGGFKAGLTWDRSKISGATNGLELSDRSAWSIPLQYSWGSHNVYAHFDKARRDKASAANAGSVQALNGNADSSSTMYALAYAYDLSKRTSAALTYARINNHSGAAYTFYNSASLGLGGGAGAIAVGEKPRMWGLTLRHQF